MTPPRTNEGKTDDSTVVAIRCPKKLADHLAKAASAGSRSISGHVQHILNSVSLEDVQWLESIREDAARKIAQWEMTENGGKQHDQFGVNGRVNIESPVFVTPAIRGRANELKKAK